MQRSIAAALFLMILAPSASRADDALCDKHDVKASIAMSEDGNVVVVWPQSAKKGSSAILVWPHSDSTTQIPEDVNLAVSYKKNCCGINVVVVWPFAPVSKAQGADCGTSTVIVWPLKAPRQANLNPGNGNAVVIWPRREKPLDNGIVVVWPTGNTLSAAITWPVVDKFPARCSDGSISVRGTCADGGGTVIVIWP